jgi:hypothetical protein
VRDRGLLVGPARGGGEGPRADPRRGAGGRRARHADAVPCAERRLRRPRAGGAPALLEGDVLHEAHRRRSRRAPRARPEGSGGELHGARLPDQRGLPPRGARRNGRRAPGRAVRHGDRGHVARSRRQREEYRVGQGLLRGPPAALLRGRVRQLHGRRRARPHPRQLQGNYERLVQVKKRYDPGKRRPVCRRTLLGRPCRAAACLSDSALRP